LDGRYKKESLVGGVFKKFFVNYSIALSHQSLTKITIKQKPTNKQAERNSWNFYHLQLHASRPRKVELQDWESATPTAEPLSPNLHEEATPTAKQQPCHRYNIQHLILTDLFPIEMLLTLTIATILLFL
jgi:hypothetical protein